MTATDTTNERLDYNRLFHVLERAIYPNGPTTMIDPEADPVVVRAKDARCSKSWASQTHNPWSNRKCN